MRRPSTIMVQAPHCPWSQPFFAPVRCRRSRTASRSEVRGSSMTWWSVPFTRRWTLTVDGVAVPGASGAVVAASASLSKGAATTAPLAALTFRKSRRLGSNSLIGKLLGGRSVLDFRQGGLHAVQEQGPAPQIRAPAGRREDQARDIRGLEPRDGP